MDSLALWFRTASFSFVKVGFRAIDAFHPRGFLTLYESSMCFSIRAAQSAAGVYPA